MNLADRIQYLRKEKGISQEELAEKMLISRQAVSKWESGQSAPDLEKIVMLSDYFEVTTDYLLKGVESENARNREEHAQSVLAGTDRQEREVIQNSAAGNLTTNHIGSREADAMIFTVAGTAINVIGLITAIMVWIEVQMPYAVSIGLIFMVVGCVFFAIGQIVCAKESRRKAAKWFGLINTWVLMFIPWSCLFNVSSGLLGGYWGMIAPIPMLGNSYKLYLAGWLAYIVICIVVNAAIGVYYRYRKTNAKCI